MAKKETLKYKKQLDKLNGRELEFTLALVETIVSEPIMEDLEIEFGVHDGDRLKNSSKDELFKKLEILYKTVEPIYQIVHSMNKSHSCHHVHDSWRDYAIEKYKNFIDAELIRDDFNLFGCEEVLDIDVNDYDSVCVLEPLDNNTHFTNLPDRTRGYVSAKDSSSDTELCIIRSLIDKDKFLILHDYKTKHWGRVVTIDESVLLSRTAKRVLNED